MDLRDAIALISPARLTTSDQSVWADLGCGTGLFTYALANLLGKGSTIYAWDKANIPLSTLPIPHDIHIKHGQLDFVEDELPVSALDGILMANSLHYVSEKPAFIKKISAHLQGRGVFLVIEYEATRANQWVPYPVPFNALTKLFQQAGFSFAVKLNERRSLYGAGHMYAALFSR